MDCPRPWPCGAWGFNPKFSSKRRNCEKLAPVSRFGPAPFARWNNWESPSVSCRGVRRRSALKFAPARGGGGGRGSGATDKNGGPAYSIFGTDYAGGGGGSYFSTGGAGGGAVFAAGAGGAGGASLPQPATTRRANAATASVLFIIEIPWRKAFFWKFRITREVSPVPSIRHQWLRVSRSVPRVLCQRMTAE